MKINFIHAARRLYWHCSILCFTVYWRTLLVFSFLHWVVNSGDQQGRICRCTFEQVVRASKHFCKHPSHIAFKREVFSLTCVLSILSEFRSWKWWCNEPINCLRFRIWTKWASLSRIKELEWISYFLSWEPNLGLRPATECFTTQTKVSIYRKTKERHKIERQATKERGGEIWTRRTQLTFPLSVFFSCTFTCCTPASLHNDGICRCCCCCCQLFCFSLSSNNIWSSTRYKRFVNSAVLWLPMVDLVPTFYLI